MNTPKHVVIFSHGFGVRKDSGGFFTEIAAAILDAEVVFFDYNEFDETNNTLTVRPFSENIKTLQVVIEEQQKIYPNATIDIVCHSQGAIIASLLKPVGIRKMIFIAPPMSMDIERSLSRYRAVPCAEINFEGTSKVPRRDGTTMLIPKEYWDERSLIAPPLELYNAMARLTDLTVIAANQDTILELSVVGIDEGIHIVALDGGHEFTDDARYGLIEAVAGLLALEEKNVAVRQFVSYNALMKRHVTAMLLLGYILLVPFCFFGGMLSAEASMDMSGGATHHVYDCGMSLPGCVYSTEAGAMDAVADHVGMYLSFSQTPLAAQSVMMVIIATFLIATFAIAFGSILAFLAQAFVRPCLRRGDESQSGIRQCILNWLSLFETSPNFA